ncbi:carbon-nitrogen hydrolase [Hahella sp. NBU794]|uniref:carbon-nitrogen hydrolase n=1 Tax=Hahella sp. NBU794 TaxID=3422590 RepID=UPI003D6FEDF1
MKKTTLQVAALQQQSFPEKEKSLALTAELIAQAAAQGAELIVLQELHATLYFCQTEDVDVFNLAESIPGPTTEFLSECARKHNVVIVGSLFEKRAPGLYHNTAVVLEKDGSLVGKYRKMHIPDDPGFYEKFYFTPGDADAEAGFKPIQTSVGKLGVLVCWDQWYPEAARLMALAGADMLIYPTAIGWDVRDDQAEHKRQLDAWITIQRAHAVANGLPVIVANRVGQEPDPSQQSPGSLFWGNSFIAGQQGEILRQADDSSVQIIAAELDLQRTDDVRRIWPYLRDRRVDAYQDLTRRYID